MPLIKYLILNLYSQFHNKHRLLISKNHNNIIPIKVATNVSQSIAATRGISNNMQVRINNTTSSYQKKYSGNILRNSMTNNMKSNVR